MAEIVPAEPIEFDEIHFEHGETSTARPHEYDHVTLAITNGNSDDNNTSSSSSKSKNKNKNKNKVEYVPGPFDSERLPTVFASEIQRFLRVANLVGREEPRVAYLCESFLLSFFFFSL